MELYINECSVHGQAQDRNEALKLIEGLFKTFSEAKNIAKEKKGFISRDLNQKIIYDSVTIQDFLRNEIDEKNPTEKRIRQHALEVLFNKPRMDPNSVHSDNKDTLVDHTSTCLKKTCFDHASSSSCGAMVISMMNNKNYTSECINLDSSLFGKRKIMNILDITTLKSLTWIYEHHSKHRNQPTMNGSKVASPMTLNQAESETVLLNGILINKRVYGYHNEKWYKFHCQENNKFHGFEFTPEQNNPEDALAVRVLSGLQFQPHGQIFSEYI